MSVILILIGAAMTLLGGTLSMIANFNLGTVLTLCLGAFLLLCGSCYRTLKRFTSHGIGRVVKGVIIVLLCVEAALVTFLVGYGMNDSADHTEDAIIVLGAGIRGEQVTSALGFRLDSAIEYYEKNPNVLIVVSGGKGLQESITEAEAMERYLLARGIPQESIIKEEKATSTYENMRFSKAILDEQLEGDYSVAVITNDFHVYRGVMYAKQAGFTAVTHQGAELMWHNLIPCYLRESLAVLKLWILS